MYICGDLSWRVPPPQWPDAMSGPRPFISRLAEENNPSVPVADVYCDADDIDGGEGDREG